MLFSNLLAKLMALVMAVAVWYYLDQRATRTLEMRFRLDLVLPEGALLLQARDADGRELGGEIPVRLRGPRRDIEALRPASLICVHTLAGAIHEPVETRAETLTAEEFNVPSLIVVEPLPSAFIRVTLASRVRRRVRVRVEAFQPAPFPYRVAVEPAEVDVQIEGAPDAVERAVAAKAVTVCVDLSGQDASEFGPSRRLLLDLQAMTSPGLPGSADLRLTPMPDASPSERKATVILTSERKTGAPGGSR